MKNALPWRSLIVALALASLSPVASAQAGADAEARAIAESVLQRMGGREAWDTTRYLGWKFMGGRQHYWDKWTGDIRIEIPAGQDRDGNPTVPVLILMNINNRTGRVWSDGVELTGDALQGGLERGWRTWVNDSYWMFMPYKLLDPGVNLKYVGEDLMADDRQADVLEMTFETVGVTPENRYLVYVAKDSGLVEQWSYFASRADSEPGFTLPWSGWQRFGRIMLATSKGRDVDWDIHVWDELPAALFTDPAFVLG